MANACNTHYIMLNKNENIIPKSDTINVFQFPVRFKTDRFWNRPGTEPMLIGYVFGPQFPFFSAFGPTVQVMLVRSYPARRK
ncbi:hypothetical protein Hanom_Chr17g01583821 [Helianthus anomalus]